ncbi:MAG TPA: alpha/beta fold hydrolase [Actinomycetota bacterium]
MTEYPVWVPSGDHQCAAVITVPDGDARALVVLVPGGGGAPRSHRFALWTRLARALTGKGFATVRLEWEGIGDSTGDPTFSFRTPNVGDLMAVTTFASEVLGVERIGLAGNCFGARTILYSFDRLPSASSVAILLVKPLARVGTAGRGALAMRRLVRLVPGLRRPARLLYWRVKGRGRGGPLAEKLRAVAARANVLLLESDSGVAGSLPRLIQALRGAGGAPLIEMRSLPGDSLQDLRASEDQQALIDTLAAWFDRSLAPHEAALQAGS